MREFGPQVGRASLVPPPGIRQCSPPISVLTTSSAQPDKISFLGPCHLPRILRQKSKSNHYSLRATNYITQLHILQ